MVGVLTNILGTITPDSATLKRLTNSAKEMVRALAEEIKKKRIKADVFIGGSFAKGTLVKKDVYDVDVYVRYTDMKKDISVETEKIVRTVAKKMGKSVNRLRGSRDYFQIRHEGVIFEIIPVKKIARPKEAENVTDLSYFHVTYVKKSAKKKEGEIRLAKAFCQGQGVYGAESYIGGFSGYALECLVINYGSFMKFLRAMANAKETIVLDPARHYKNKQEISLHMNSAKLTSPLICVDPTFKERNAVAALRPETFALFQEAARKFIKHPNEHFFEYKAFDFQQWKTKAERGNFSLVSIELSTDRQAGDIAGTKMKKYARFIEQELSNIADKLESSFVYEGKQEATAYILGKMKKNILKEGPPATFDKHVTFFKKEHKNAFLKKGRWYASVDVRGLFESVKDIVENQKVRNGMGITSASVREIN